MSTQAQTRRLEAVHLPPGPVMVDVAGTSLTAAEVHRLQHPLTGGVILFARNFTDRAQLAALVADIHACRQEPLLVCVDHEGGRVQRFRSDGFTPLPDMRRLGEAWDADPLTALRLACDTGYVLAAELRACGVDFSFTPVLDLDYGRSGVIGRRALHHDPAVVAQLARALLQGLALAGMAACGKHFPGHGWVEADSHHAVPVDERGLKAILAADALPYGALTERVLPSVMPAHVIYPAVDDQPAGFSRRWLQDILRDQLAYDGVIFSDDLCMAGAGVAGDILARAEAALGAGCDMVLVCNEPDQADLLLQRLPLPDMTRRIVRLQRLRAVVPAPDWAALQASDRYRRATASVAELEGAA